MDDDMIIEWRNQPTSDSLSLSPFQNNSFSAANIRHYFSSPATLHKIDKIMLIFYSLLYILQTTALTLIIIQSTESSNSSLSDSSSTKGKESPTESTTNNKLSSILILSFLAIFMLHTLLSIILHGIRLTYPSLHNNTNNSCNLYYFYSHILLFSFLVISTLITTVLVVLDYIHSTSYYLFIPVLSIAGLLIIFPCILNPMIYLLCELNPNECHFLFPYIPIDNTTVPTPPLTNIEILSLSLPLIIYTNNSDISSSNSSTHCSICLSDYELNNELHKLPCNHIYHAPCIIEWLKRSSRCPLCCGKVTPNNIKEMKEIELQ